MTEYLKAGEQRVDMGSSDEEGGGGAEDIEILCHATSFKASKNDGSEANSLASMVSDEGKMPVRSRGDISVCNAGG